MKIILAIAEYFEVQGNIKDNEKLRFCKIWVSCACCLPLYRSALRAHIKANARALGILEMIESFKEIRLSWMRRHRY